MYWTKEHDILLCREILSVDPFDTKKGTAQRGEKWKNIADNLMTIQHPRFKVELRSVRDRYCLLAQKVQRKLNEEKKESEIETDMEEWESAVEELIEKEEESDRASDADSEKKNKGKEEDRQTAEGIRKRAMERLEKENKASDNTEGKPKK